MILQHRTTTMDNAKRPAFREGRAAPLIQILAWLFLAFSTLSIIAHFATKKFLSRPFIKADFILLAALVSKWTIMWYAHVWLVFLQLLAIGQTVTFLCRAGQAIGNSQADLSGETIMQAWKVSKSPNAWNTILKAIGFLHWRASLYTHHCCGKGCFTHSFHDNNTCSQASNQHVYHMCSHCIVGIKRRTSHRVSVSISAEMGYHKLRMYRYCEPCSWWSHIFPNWSNPESGPNIQRHHEHHDWSRARHCPDINGYSTSDQFQDTAYPSSRILVSFNVCITILVLNFDRMITDNLMQSVVIASVVQIVFIRTLFTYNDLLYCIWPVVVCGQIVQVTSIMTSTIPFLKPFLLSLESSLALSANSTVRATTTTTYTSAGKAVHVLSYISIDTQQSYTARADKQNSIWVRTDFQVQGEPSLELPKLGRD